MTQAVLKERFLREYGRELVERKAMLFVGAGLSIPAGFVDWRNLLRELASDLGLDVDKEMDLLSVAQFHKNTNESRHKIDQTLIDEFSRKSQLTRNHELIASLPVSTVWTTNYDTLLEKAFEGIGRRPDVKHTKEHLSKRVRGADVTVYKMHGDVSMPHEAVLTRDDYEEYDLKRGLFSEKLQGDLVSDTFLFLGFSFTDPNIDFILRRIRILLGANRRTHFCVMKKPDEPTEQSGEGKANHEYEVRRLELRMQDLKRYGTLTVLVDDYGEIQELLLELNRISHQREVFISGSAYDYSPLGEEIIQDLSRALGRELIQNNLNIISGFGLGIGERVLVGAMEAIYSGEATAIDDRILIRPFPQSYPIGVSREEMWEKYRQDMIGQAGHVVFIAGNKLDSTGNVAQANGVQREFEIAKQHGKTLIPIGASGHVAAELWDEVYANREQYFQRVDVTQELENLNNATLSVAAYVAAIVAIIHKVNNR